MLVQVFQNCDCEQHVLTDFNLHINSHQERFKVVHSLTMPILAMLLTGNSTGNSTCLRGAIQDHYGPLVIGKDSISLTAVIIASFQVSP